MPFCLTCRALVRHEIPRTSSETGRFETGPARFASARCLRCSICQIRAGKFKYRRVEPQPWPSTTPLALAGPKLKAQTHTNGDDGAESPKRIPFILLAKLIVVSAQLAAQPIARRPAAQPLGRWLLANWKQSASSQVKYRYLVARRIRLGFYLGLTSLPWPC